MASPGNDLDVQDGATGMKRRQSSESEQQENKRPRISPGKTSPDTNHHQSSNGGNDNAAVQERRFSQGQMEQSQPQQQPTDTKQRRNRGTVDAKERSRRLFGAALLGNLTQGNDRTAKRRQEIENRRKAELQRQDDERLEDKQRRLEQLHERRRKEQVDVDRTTMRIRHDNLLHQARFLQTKTEPTIYFRPWELRPDEEDLIDQQVSDAQHQIDREADEFDSKHGVDRRPTNGTAQVDGPVESAAPEDSSKYQREDAGERPNQPPDSDSGGASTAQAHQTEDRDHDEKVPTATEAESPAKIPTMGENKGEVLDDEGDHIVEADEDTVIY